MANIKLFIATSIDGYIARLDGSLDWLDDIPNPDHIDHGYHDFYGGIGTLFMGRKTYEAIQNMDVDWPYENASTYILTRNTHYTAITPHTYVVNEDILGLVKDLRETEKKDIWLVGGGELVSMFMDLALIDEMILSIPLFASDSKQVNFKLLDSRVFETGIINLHYVQDEEN